MNEELMNEWKDEWTNERTNKWINKYLSRHNECEVPDCNNHGECQAGVCVCSRGYTGLFCQQGKIRKDYIKVSLINETMTKQQFGKLEKII